MKRLENRAEIHEKKHMEKGNQLQPVPTLEVVNSSICFYFEILKVCLLFWIPFQNPPGFLVMGLFHQQT